MPQPGGPPKPLSTQRLGAMAALEMVSANLPKENSSDESQEETLCMLHEGQGHCMLHEHCML